MSDKRRSITIGIVVAIFIIANIIAGVYKWGSSVKTPDNQELQAEKAGETGDQAKQINEQSNEMQSSKGPVTAPEEKTDSDETGGDPVILEYQAQLASLKKENASLLSRLKSDNDLADQNLKLKGQLQSVLVANKKLEKENDELRSAEKIQGETDTSQSELQQQILSFKNEKSALENEIDGLRDELLDKQTLATQNQQFSEQVRECSAARELLQKETAEMQTRIDQYQNLAAENQQLRAKLGDSNRENEALKARLDKIRTMVDVE